MRSFRAGGNDVRSQNAAAHEVSRSFTAANTRTRRKHSERSGLAHACDHLQPAKHLRCAGVSQKDSSVCLFFNSCDLRLGAELISTRWSQDKESSEYLLSNCTGSRALPEKFVSCARGQSSRASPSTIGHGRTRRISKGRALLPVQFPVGQDQPGFRKTRTANSG